MDEALADDGGWRYAIGVGANLGERAATIDSAARALEASGGARFVSRSGLIESAPVGGPSGQGPYLNGAWVISSALGPPELLRLLQRIESEHGRTRETRWGARTLDLDLLLRDDGLVIDSPELTLPHPRLHERAFVLRPLAGIAGDWPHPGIGMTISALASRLPP